MFRILSAAAVVALSLCGAAQAQTQGERAVGGALIGGALGAVVGGAVGGNVGGALIGAGVGGVTGAAVGAATTPQDRRRPLYRNGRQVYRNGQPVYYAAPPPRRRAQTVCRINRYGEEVCRVYR